MTLEYDASIQPVRPSQKSELLGAIYSAADEDETDWLEWKSELDLSERKGQFTVARQILGAANRSPNDAVQWVNGFGYIAVGLEPGRVDGVERVDPADLEGRLQKYLGDGDGPSYSPSYHDFRGKTVLLVEVSPPRIGSRSFPLRKTFTDSKEGTIFVRRGGSTHPASSAEIRMLEDRMLGASGEQSARIEVRCPTHILRPTATAGYKRTFIEKRRHGLLSSVPEPAPTDLFPSLLPSMRIGAIAGLAYEETRSVEEFKAQVEDYVEALEGSDFRPEIQLYLGSLDDATPTFQLRNLSEVNLEELSLDIHLPGDVWGFRESDVHGAADRIRPPRKWGVAPRNHPSRALDRLGLQSIPMYPSAESSGPVPTKPAFRNDGSVTLNYFDPHVRPKEEVMVRRGMVYVGPDDGRSTITATWHATARNIDKEFSGIVEVPVEAVVLPADW